MISATEHNQLREAYETLFEKVPCYVAVLDRDLRIVQANRMLRDAFGNGLSVLAVIGVKIGRGKQQITNDSHQSELSSYPMPSAEHSSRGST